MIATIDSNDLDRFRALIERKLGLQCEDQKLGMLAEVLRLKLEATGQPARAYLSRLEAGPPAGEDWQWLAQQLTVGETYFFRHAEQYRAFAEVALPDRLAYSRATQSPVQILSAGCASGEEPYTLAIVAQTAAIDPLAVSIQGVDINAAFLERARRARYSSWVLRETPADLRRQWFLPEGRDFVLDESVRRSVRFDLGNLADERSAFFQAEFDVIFCRNVLMYFATPTAQDVVGRLARALRPGGYLFLGHAETLRGLSSDFHLMHTHETFYYQRKGELKPMERRPFTSQVRVESPAALAALVDDSGTWVEAIRRASDRIEALTHLPAPPASRVGVRSSAQPAWETGLALELLREERFAEALRLIDAFPRESDRDTEVLLLRAVLLTLGGRLPEAQRACERLLAIDELNAGAHYVLALCREGEGDRPGAVHHDQVATYLDPGFAMAHLHLGLLARRAGDLPTARRELEEALALVKREDASRLLLFGGGFSRDSLMALCRAELANSGGLS